MNVKRGNVNIILIGAQGSGKSTQAEKLSLALGICHVSSGDLFRKNFPMKTELHLKAKMYLEKGILVPDAIAVAMVLERILQPDCHSGILLDGFPRTLSQARALDEHLQRMKQHIDWTIYLAVPREELLKRLSGRYLCRANHHIYNIYTSPPKKPGVCDIDGSELYQRTDDTGASIQRRLDTFFNETIRLLDYYRKQQKLITVNGYQAIEQVYTDIIRAIQNPDGGIVLPPGR